jgi:hypothetical protein
MMPAVGDSPIFISALADLVLQVAGIGADLPQKEVGKLAESS